MRNIVIRGYTLADFIQVALRGFSQLCSQGAKGYQYAS